jgi:glycosyltransferase involved in cell wall biosynthesis
MKKTEQIKFSFVIPVRDGQQTLGLALSSIQKQSLQNFEIIVVDNNSSDHSAKLAREFEGVKLISVLEPSRSKARNAGARLIVGQFICFIDCDVELNEQWLKECLKILDKYDLDFLATQIKPSGWQGSMLGTYREIRSAYRTNQSFISLCGPNGIAPIVNSAACVVSRECFIITGGFDESMLREEDYEFSQRAFRQGFLVGGTSKAKAEVLWTPKYAFTPLAEIAYLWRAFEIGHLS